jgi:hypothetical protein
MMVVGALLLYRLVLLHADHPVGVVVMGNNGGYQHNDVIKNSIVTMNRFFPFILYLYRAF